MNGLKSPLPFQLDPLHLAAEAGNAKRPGRQGQRPAFLAFARHDLPFVQELLV